MNYEQRYEEALARAKDNYNAANSANINVDSFKNTLIHIFPELKETEDEKMKKSIIYALRNGGFYNNDKTDEAIAWLKKQGKQTDIANKEYWRGYREGKQEILDKYAELEKQSEYKSIDKSNTSDHWQHLREMAAIAAMQGVMNFFGSLDYDRETIAELAVKQADALVKKLKGE